jgi:hypothetical protein
MIPYPAAVQDMIGNILTQVRQASDNARRRWYTQGSEIALYGYAPTHRFQYQSIPDAAFFEAKEALTSECIRVMSPYLYAQNPHRTINLREDSDPIIAQAANVAGEYLNHAVKEYDVTWNARAAIDQSLCWGRGIRWTGRHPKKPDIICSLFDNIEYFFDDPEAKCAEDRRIAGRLRKRPIEDVIRELPDCADAIRMVSRDNKNTDSCSDMLEYYEFYAICGIWRFQSNGALAAAMRQGGVEPSDQPLRYLVTTQGKFICATEWEVPLYLDGEWPFEILDHFDYPGEIWPVSPLEPGLNYQRAINWTSTLMMGRMRRAMRLIYAMNDVNGQGLDEIAEQQVIQGTDMEVLLLKITGNKSITDFLKEAPVDFTWLDKGMQHLDYLQRRYDQVTGKYAILYTGVGDTQSRSATDAEMRQNNSRSRLDSMRQNIVRWEKQTARKESMCARFLLKGPQIAKLLGEKKGALWGFIAAPDAKSKFASQMIEMGFPQEEAMAMAEQTFGDAIDFQRWIDETDFDVEADSIRRFDYDQRMAMWKELSNQTLPAMIQSPNLTVQSAGYIGMATYLKDAGADPAFVRSLMAMAKAFQETAANPPAAPPAVEGAGADAAPL